MLPPSAWLVTLSTKNLALMMNSPIATMYMGISSMWLAIVKQRSRIR
ncbi:hypothetical protein JYQ62_02035 [Nostoc sp. UHCC 0702]|nr:hypothetical protein JYQ62_02035 [Nostoc sp. UHCC 0702]